MPQCFISYASEDAIFADLTKMKLREGGIDVWLDHTDLRGGDEWRNSIDDGISSSPTLLVVITPESCKSPYVTYEWAFALGNKKRVIPLLLKDAEIHPRLAVLQYLDFRNPRVGPWKELFEEVAKNSMPLAARQDPDYVRDMTIKQLQDLIGGAISLAAATAKSTGREAGPEDISRAARSVVDVAQSASLKTSSSNQTAQEILWVDDIPDNNIHERAAFEAMGFRFTLARSTNEALHILSNREFGAIISDMGRQEGPQEGYVLLDAFRSRDDKTPFFIYAGSNSREHKRQATERGAQGCTDRPQELFDLVTQYVKPVLKTEGERK